MTINPGSGQKQDCRATKLKFAEIKKDAFHRRRSSVNFRGQDIFCPKNMYEK